MRWESKSQEHPEVAVVRACISASCRGEAAVGWRSEDAPARGAAAARKKNEKLEKLMVLDFVFSGTRCFNGGVVGYTRMCGVYYLLPDTQ